MNTITISTENEETFSSISNNFIDYYMTEANGDFVKLYLYLVRLYNSGLPISVSSIADHFICTENDVCRAIRYWISVDVLRFRYSENGEISGIVLLNLSKPQKKNNQVPNIVNFASLQTPSALQAISTQASNKSKTVDKPVSVTKLNKAPVKERHNLKAINDNLKDEVFSGIIMQAEAYFNKTITQSDTDTLIYIYDTLKLSVDLIEYLLEYCASIGKTKFSYIEAVAINWYESGITTREEASQQSLAYNPLYKAIFKELGITQRSVPSSTELAFIEAWQQEYGFEDSIILEACKRAVLSKPNSANFSYVNGILENWHKNNVNSFSDISKADDAFKAKYSKNTKSNSKPDSKSGSKPGAFSNFQQKDMNNELDEIAKLFINEVNES